MTNTEYKCINLFETMKSLLSPLRKTADRFDHFDFVSGDNKLWVEVKGRNCASTQYATTVVGVCKTQHAERVLFKRYQDAEVYFLFEFTDKCMCIKYDKQVWSRYQIADMYGRPHWFIPISECFEL